MKQIIVDLLAKATKLKKEEIEKIIEIPPNSEMGDYAFPCYILSKELRKNPAEIAMELAREINKNKKSLKEISRVECKGPYLNFFIDKKMLAKQILAKATVSEFGSAKEKQKILVEHTSVNPNASPHVGRTRNSIIGDSIVRILKFRGNNIETHNYVSISKKLEKNPSLEKQIFQLLERFENKDKKTVDLFRKIVGICVQGQKQLFEELGIKFDKFDYESEYVGSFSKELLKKFEKTGKLFEDKEGRLVLNQSNTPVARKMKAPYFVLARSNGTGLYGLRDIAYTLDKMKKGKNIIVLGEDQKLYFEQIKEALKLLNSPYPEVVHYSFVLLQTDSGARKMSTRRGELVLLEEFLKESVKKAQEEIKKRKTKGDAKKIAIAAIKYAMLRNDNDKNIIFSWENSLNFEGDSGPYLQYSYARASSIIRKAEKSKLKSKSKSYDIPELTSQEINLIKKISEFPQTVEKAEKQLNPSIIANYSFQLSQSFNEFYHSCKVLGEDCEEFRIKLVNAFRTTIKNSLYLLGIEVMEEM